MRKYAKKNSTTLISLLTVAVNHKGKYLLLSEKQMLHQRKEAYSLMSCFYTMCFLRVCARVLQNLKKPNRTPWNPFAAETRDFSNFCAITFFWSCDLFRSVRKMLHWNENDKSCSGRWQKISSLCGKIYATTKKPEWYSQKFKHKQWTESLTQSSLQNGKR